jgi:tRNA 5-methylaminomethyl-2-thiouridine biosynthesis bifunctional protein
MQIPPYLLNTHYNDRYFDVVNAVHEAKQVFFKGTFLLEKLHYSIKNPKQVSIGETGFGPGRNLLSLIDYLSDSDLNNILLTYNTCELHPVSPEQMAMILECFRDQAGDSIDQVLSLYNRIDTSIPGWHHEEIELSFGKIVFNLYVGEALEMVQSLENPCDIWFLDGHGPKTNPEIWRRELLLAVGEKTCSGGTCATYTVAGDVKRALTEAGFQVEKVQGCGGKKEVLRGVKNF